MIPGQLVTQRDGGSRNYRLANGHHAESGVAYGKVQRRRKERILGKLDWHKYALQKTTTGPHRVADEGHTISDTRQ